VSGIIATFCDCTLTRHFRDGSTDVCDCCGPCAAGFCSDAGGTDCACTPEIVSDSVKSCTASYVSEDGNITCDITFSIDLAMS
jgi:hypothetical protein